MLAPESGEEGAALLPAARPLVVLGRFVLLTATGYRLPAQPAAPRETCAQGLSRRDDCTY
jgi:hypothetical protein